MHDRLDDGRGGLGQMEAREGEASGAFGGRSKTGDLTGLLISEQGGRPCINILSRYCSPGEGAYSK